MREAANPGEMRAQFGSTPRDALRRPFGLHAQRPTREPEPRTRGVPTKRWWPHRWPQRARGWHRRVNTTTTQQRKVLQDDLLAFVVATLEERRVRCGREPEADARRVAARPRRHAPSPAANRRLEQRRPPSVPPSPWEDARGGGSNAMGVGNRAMQSRTQEGQPIPTRWLALRRRRGKAATPDATADLAHPVAERRRTTT